MSTPPLRLPTENGDARSATATREAWRRQLTVGLEALYRYIYFRVGMDAHTAEEILQQTACAALQYENAPEAEKEKQMILCGIAKNLIRRHWRSLNRQPETRLRAEPNAALDLVKRMETPNGGETLEIAREQRHQLQLAVSALDTEEQWLLYACYKYGRSRADIAAELGVSCKSVESRLYRMRIRLREQLHSLVRKD